MKIPERYDDASSGRWRCWWWRVIQLPICQPQRGGRATTDCSTLVQRKPQSFPWNPNPRLAHTLQCSAVLRLLQPPEVANLVLCWRKCCTRDVCSVLHTNISQCSVTPWQCNVCRVDLCAGSITQSIAHLVGRYYLLIFIEFSLLFPSAQLCTRHCHAHRG